MQKAKLAILGGKPVRSSILPYGHQIVDSADIRSVEEALRSDWLTTGPKVQEFEDSFALYTGVKEAVAVSNGTTALHASMYAVGIEHGDEVIVPAMTFASTANAVVFQGATPVFADSDPRTLLIDPKDTARKITKKTKAVIAVDYAGQACDYDALSTIAADAGITLVADACHALGGAYKRRPIGVLADLSTFSFHPVKPITTGEGGMITTDNPECASRMRRFRNHCLSSDNRERHEKGSWFYEMTDLGYNYRLTDFQCALGLSQLKKVRQWTLRRQEIAQQYSSAFANLSLTPLKVRPEVSHAYHLYVVLLETEKLSVGRDEIFRALRAEGIGVNVHYIPVHLHPFYREKFGTGPGQCPIAEAAFERMISLPLFAGMTDQDSSDVIEAVQKVCSFYVL